jgi:hypothetical protein
MMDRSGAEGQKAGGGGDFGRSSGGIGRGGGHTGSAEKKDYDGLPDAKDDSKPKMETDGASSNPPGNDKARGGVRV